MPPAQNGWIPWILRRTKVMRTLIYHAAWLFSMGGLGRCPCCKKDKELTEHHVKEMGKKIMVCRDCHNIIEEYLKLLAKYDKLL